MLISQNRKTAESSPNAKSLCHRTRQLAPHTAFHVQLGVMFEKGPTLKGTISLDLFFSRLFGREVEMYTAFTGESW